MLVNVKQRAVEDRWCDFRHSATMKRPVVNEALAARLKSARRTRGLTQAQLAERLGEIGQTGVSEAESGRIYRPDRLRDYARVLGVTEEWLMGEGSSELPAVPPQSLSRPAPNAGAPEYTRLDVGARLPVYGHAAGGFNGRFIMNGQAITDVFCPPVLVGVKGAYAVYVHGDSMSPRYEAGETVWLHPYLPVRSGDYVVAQVRGDRMAEGEPPDAYIKQFVSRTRSGGLVLKQLNPPEGESNILNFDDENVFSVHKIVFSGMS